MNTTHPTAKSKGQTWQYTDLSGKEIMGQVIRTAKIPALGITTYMWVGHRIYGFPTLKQGSWKLISVKSLGPRWVKVHDFAHRKNWTFIME